MKTIRKGKHRRKIPLLSHKDVLSKGQNKASTKVEYIRL